MDELPAPSTHALATSAELSALIRREIETAGGSIPFSRYMERCLYQPGLGYYSAGSRKFGAAGDFITAPEITPLFGRCLAQTCSHVLAETGQGDILEFGAGSGRLAVDLLSALEKLDRLPEHYYILERSAELRERQQHLLGAQLPGLGDRIIWLDTLPENGFHGVMLANEVLDAMPVERFRWSGEVVEQFCVECNQDGFGWCLEAVHDNGLAVAVQKLQQDHDLGAGYVSEINLSLASWLGSLAELLDQGLVLLIDYGYPRHEYYHPQRHSGTLMCHYRHRAHDNPFTWPGLQDITAHVDFTALAEAGVGAGLEVAGYTTQAWFLLDCGLENLLPAAGITDSAADLLLAQQAKKLILPGEMGERFKFIGLAKDLAGPVPGFRLQDQRGRL